jgi:hypothetical protein
VPKVYTIPVVIVTLEEDEGPDAASFSVLIEVDLGLLFQ